MRTKAQIKINKQYEEERNKLIPEAKKYTDEISGLQSRKEWSGLTGITNEDNRRKWYDTWNLAFHTKMNTLAYEKGLTN